MLLYKFSPNIEIAKQISIGKEFVVRVKTLQQYDLMFIKAVLFHQCIHEDV